MAKRLANITKQHMEAMDLRLQGMTYKVISIQLGKSVRTIESWFGMDDLFKAEFQRIQEENIERARNILINYAPESARNMIAIASGDKQGRGVKNMLDANINILDRVGLKPVEKQEMDMKQHLTIVDDLP